MPDDTILTVKNLVTAFDTEQGRIRAVGSTGSPLTVSGFEWVYENINKHLALESLSGGTDLCTAFVGGVRLLPIYAGEIQGAGLVGDGPQVLRQAGTTERKARAQVSGGDVQVGIFTEQAHDLAAIDAHGTAQPPTA